LAGQKQNTSIVRRTYSAPPLCGFTVGGPSPRWWPVSWRRGASQEAHDALQARPPSTPQGSLAHAGAAARAVRLDVRVSLVLYHGRSSPRSRTTERSGRAVGGSRWRDDRHGRCSTSSSRTHHILSLLGVAARADRSTQLARLSADAVVHEVSISIPRAVFLFGLAVTRRERRAARARDLPSRRHRRRPPVLRYAAADAWQASIEQGRWTRLPAGCFASRRRVGCARAGCWRRVIGRALRRAPA